MSLPFFSDLETFSTVPIKAGTHAYAEQAEIMLWTYAFGDGPVQCWDATADALPPTDLLEAITDPSITLVGHNWGMFDYTIVKHARPELLVPHERVFDTMVCALLHALPAGLGELCHVLGVEDDKLKSKEGKKLIQLFCKPRPAGNKLRRATRETHPVEWQAFIEYAKQDIVSTREAYYKLPRRNYTEGERELWLLDQRVNQRGVAVDVALAKAAIRAADREQVLLAQRTQVLTQGAVLATTQRDRLLEHLFESFGVSLPDLQMDTVERRLNDPDLPEGVKELLRMRLQASSTSVSKYRALLKAVSADGRLRGLLQFSGAARTRRWSGRTFQPQNLPRPNMQKNDIAFAIEAVKADAAELFYDEVMPVLVNCIRGTLVAPPGRKLVVADLANIEGRVAAWVAGEEWKLEAFRAYDRKEGPDLYRVSYGRALNLLPEDVNDVERQIGKVFELMLQYQGGAGAFATGAVTYRIDMDALTASARETIAAEVWGEATSFYKWQVVKNKRTSYGLSEDTYIACDALKRLWRAAHPRMCALWDDLDASMRNAIANPGEVFRVNGMAIAVKGSWLFVRLPSGGHLCYLQPLIVDGNITYKGQDTYTKKWCRLKTYGGKVLENICQSIARDVMAASMPLAEAAGYAIVLTAHDELITEAPDEEQYNEQHLSTIMAAPSHAWLEGLPLAAAGFSAYRYRKG